MFLIIKSIFRIHPFFYILMFICFFTGNIRDFFIFFSLIVVHEFGHILFGLLFSWKIEKIIFLPFGCLTIFNNLVNTSLFEQFVVTLMGPLFQIIFFLIINYFFNIPSCVCFFNYILLFFNLLPIYPLDGSKFLYILFCLFIPFKYCFLLLLFVSLVFIFLVLVFVEFDLLILLVLFFLFFRVVFKLKNIKVIFYKFLFERYIYDFHFKYIKRVNSLSGMYLWCRHLFYDDKKYVSEREKLLKMFDKRYKL